METATPGAGHVAVGVRCPGLEDLWLFEAVVRLRLESGCSHAFAVAAFQDLFPRSDVQARLERAVAQLMRVMQAHYDASVEAGSTAAPNGTGHGAPRERRF
jgi:hypothetical protein